MATGDQACVGVPRDGDLRAVLVRAPGSPCGRLPGIGGPSPGSRRVAGLRALPPRSLSTATAWAQCDVDRDEGGFRVPRYLLINGAEPRWRLHDTVDSADLEKSLARVMENGVITYTLASCNEGETFQSLTINGKNLVTYLITGEADPDPARTRSRYEATGF
jgi:hypothetical protein